MAKFLSGMAESSDGFDCRCCDKTITEKEQYLLCGGVCGSYVHLDCTQLNKHAVNAVNEYENIIYMCDECISHSIRTVNNKVDGIYTILNRIEQQLANTNKSIQEIKNEKSNDKSNKNVEKSKKDTYASVVKPKRVVLVKPKTDSGDSKKTREAIKKNIDPKTVKVNAVSNIANGGVAIECDDDETAAQIKKITMDTMGNEFNIEDPKKRKFRLKIVGIQEEIGNEELVDILKTQNEWLPKESEIKIVKMYSVKGKYNSAIIELDRDNFNRCIELGSVRIGWNLCKLYEEIPLTVCVKCCGYSHIAKECKQTNIACRKCGGNHKMIDCIVEIPKCINCVAANKKHGFKFDVKHTASDTKCEVRKQKVEMAKRRIDQMQ